jgi:AcrR family transcriptional regulator
MPETELDPEATALSREPQQARSRRTLERLRAAAWSLLEAEGPEGVTVTGVAAEAGVSVGSFYARFEGKEELLDHLEAVALDQALRRLSEVLDEEAGPLELLEEVVALYRRGPAERLLLLARTDGRSPRRLHHLSRVVAESLARRLGSDEPGTLLRAAALAGAARELALAAGDGEEGWLAESSLGDAGDPDRPIISALAALLGEGSGTSTPTEFPAAAPAGPAEPAGRAPTEDPAPVPPGEHADPEHGPAEERSLPDDEPENPASTDAPETPEDRDEPDPEPPPVELFDVWG